jgi:hypothetical protein
MLQKKTERSLCGVCDHLLRAVLAGREFLAAGSNRPLLRFGG